MMENKKKESAKENVKRIRAIEWAVFFACGWFLIFKFILLNLLSHIPPEESDFLTYFWGVALFITALTMGYFIGLFLFSLYHILMSAVQDITRVVQKKEKPVIKFIIVSLGICFITPFVVILMNKSLKDAGLIIGIIAGIVTIIYTPLNYHKKRSKKKSEEKERNKGVD